MPAIPKKIEIRGGPWYNKVVMWSGCLRPTAKKIPVIQGGEIMIKNVCVTD